MHKRYVKHRTGAYRVLAISESLLTAWEASKGMQFVSSRRAEAAKRAEANGLALARKRAWIKRDPIDPNAASV